MTLHVLATAGVISESEYLVCVGRLGAMRHGHLWLDAPTLVRMLTLEDPRAFSLYEAAIYFMGGRNAEMQSDLNVMVEMMRGVWSTELPNWQQGRAIGRLIEQLIRSRPKDWKAMLHILDAELDWLGRHGDRLARLARDYLENWIVGHFYDLAEIRSAERVEEALAPKRRMRPARSTTIKKASCG